MNSKVWGFQNWLTMVPFNRIGLMVMVSLSGILSLELEWLWEIYVEIPKVTCTNMGLIQEFPETEKKKKSILIKSRWWEPTLPKV